VTGSGDAGKPTVAQLASEVHREKLHASWYELGGILLAVVIARWQFGDRFDGFIAGGTFLAVVGMVAWWWIRFQRGRWNRIVAATEIRAVRIVDRRYLVVGSGSREAKTHVGTRLGVMLPSGEVEVEVPAELEARALWIFRAVSVRAAPPS
jgi:hypothetical protein